MRTTDRHFPSVAARRAAGVLLLALLPALTASGCLFAPRAAEPPQSGTDVQYIPRTQPEAVLENLDKAIHARDSVGYLDQISPSFRYFPDGQTTTDYPGVDWANWDHAREQAFIERLFNNISAAEASLREVAVNYTPYSSGTTVEWRFIYSIKVTSPGSTTATPYRGRATFKLALEGSFWALTEWRDEQGEAAPGSGATLPTSGILRGAIVAGGS